MSILIRTIHRLFITIILLASGMPSPAIAQPEEETFTKTVVVIGTETIYKNDSASAREHAISKSLIAAVDLVIENLTPLDSLIQNFQALNNVLCGNTEYFLADYKVLAEAISGKKYRVLVQATVSIDYVVEQLSSIGIVLGGKTMPRILFFIAEQNVEDVFSQYWWGKDFGLIKADSEIAMSEAMRKKGFPVVYHEDIFPDRAPEKTNGELLWNTPDLSNEAAMDLGIRFEADVVVIGKSIARQTSNTMGINLRSFEGTSTVRALWTDTGEKITATKQTAVTVNTQKLEGGREALAKAGFLVGEELASKIAIAWQEKTKKCVPVELVVEGTTPLASFAMFRRVINAMPGVGGLTIKELKPNEAILIVDFQGNAKEFADALMFETFESFGINIYEVSQNRLRVELVSNQTLSNG